MRYAKHTTRRGVLLLVILALLAMFGMVAVTFVVVASQARLSAEAHQRLDETTDPPRKLLNAAVMQVLRGSTNPASAIGPHSLLEDVYGFNNAVGPFAPSSVTDLAGGALIEVGTSLTLAEARRCVGGVLTVTQVATTPTTVMGRSARIIDAADNSGIVLRILPFDGISVAEAVSQLSGGCTVLVNRAPFTGAGFTAQALRPGHPDNRLSGVYANEDYDAADFQNMILAAQIPVGTTGQVVTIPSLHRPALVNYNGGTPDSSYVLRPLPTVHGSFTGSNSAFDLIDGPWDVDNDGDGIADSIWVDLGMPARAAPDGQLYKPLFAILCVDMDGKLNVNAHGGLAQINADPSGATGDYYANPTPTTTGQQFVGTASLGRGQGYGPAEINLGALFSITLGANNGYQALLTGGSSGQPGRYGSDGVPGASGIDSPGQRRWFDYDYTAGYWPATGAPVFGGFSGYGTPPDMQGTMAVGLDLAGRPIWDQSYSGQVGADNPYESNPTHRIARGAVDPSQDDAPFSPAELERVLRCYDRDSLTLPTRLYELLQLGGVDVRYLRHDMTSDSVDVPVAGIWVDPANPASGTRYASLAELLQAKYGIDAVRAVELFGRDLAAGRKLNLNRPLPASDVVARQELARHLFCLAMLLRDPAYRFPFPTTDPNVSGKEEQLTIKRIAQWAVNVVDFIDADSTMTPFEYVEDPFASGAIWPTGLPVSGTTDVTKLVWGMERPVLLLTETLAFHDRRVADTAFDDSTRSADQKKRTDKKTGSDPPEPADPDLDQPRRPEGSLFVELYCAMEPGAKPTSDLFTDTGALDLRRRAGSAPVWRLAITTKATSTASNNNLPHRLNEAPATFTLETDQGASLASLSGVSELEIERLVTFLSVKTPSRLPDVEFGPVPVYYNHLDIDVSLRPGEYLLVGPRASTAVGSTTASPPAPSPQKLIVDPAVSITNLQGASTLESNIKTPKGMAAGAQVPGDWGKFVGLSISEPFPTNYYPTPSVAGSDGVTDWYGDPDSGPFLDQPLDNQDGMPLKGMTGTGTTKAYKYVLLERLADPMRSYDAITNPYRTVDWMPVDLTVFNGQDTMPEWPPAWAVDGEGNAVDVGDWDLDDPDPNAAVEFDTRERGTDGGTEQNLWEQNQFSTPQPTARGSASAHFPCDLEHSLGYLNTTFGSPGGGTGIHKGDPAPPAPPFPWITWNNRPPASPYELMMVPATTAARHGWEFTMAAAGGPSAPYTPGADAGQYVYNAANVGYAHLMNFFHSSDTSGTASELHRIFDYVATPSRFAGAQHYVSGLTEPDHLQPTYREPGKVNLNTIYSERVFRGLMNGFGATDAGLWYRFQLSRQGYSANPESYPTEFARPFRSAAGAHLWPGSALAPAREIESTLLRADPVNTETPLFALSSTDPINDTGRNPYFRHQGLMRLANLTTTRSNVYAVWITVGYFEAMPTSDTSIPGRYLLGRELGVETGEIRRHRAFYMIDRSIPVGFVRGEDMNVESTIMLQRYIE